MNNLEFELLNGYLEQLSFKTQNTINELQLVKRHIDGFKSQITKRDISEQTRASIPEQILSIEQTQTRDKQPSDLIRIKEVMSMTGLSRSSIYTQKNKGEFPRPIHLTSHSIAWVRSEVEQWILDKINNR
ncbi:AlpA family transcriptional regulator [Colwellia sp. Bg11-12]|nr:AlpA family transcriptional regulator [Colwellia sp. Bg11-12]